MTVDGSLSLLEIDNNSLDKFFEANKYFISEGDRNYLEEFVIQGIPENLRRKYWLSISGAYGYMHHYYDGYYKALSMDDNDSAYPTWPHPDYQ